MPRNAKPVTGRNNDKAHLANNVYNNRAGAEKKILPNSRKLICPKYLPEEARKEWNRIKRIDSQREIPLIFDTDVQALTMVCMEYAVFKSAMEEWSSDPHLVDSDEGKVKANPCVVELNKTFKNLLAGYQQFGLTPSGRASIAADLAKLLGDAVADEDFDPDLD